MKKYLMLAMLLGTSSASADQGFNLMYSVGLTGGGEKMAETNTGSSLTTGGLMLFSIGTTYQFENPAFQIQAAFGYHFDELNADNGSADFKRTYVELIPFYVMDNIRVGMGVINVMSPEYSDPFGGIKFDDASGTVLEVNWRLGNRGWWGLRYADLTYEANSLDGIPVTGSFDGSYFGVTLTGGF